MQTTKQHLGRPMIFDQSHLDALQEAAEQEYRKSLRALHRADRPLFPLFINEAIRLAGEGYTIHPTLPASAGPGHYSAFFVKPEALQAADLEQIKVEVKEKYLSDIEAHNKAQIELLTKQLFEQEQAKELRKQEEKENKQRTQAAADAQEYFNSLITKSQETK